MIIERSGSFRLSAFNAIVKMKDFPNKSSSTDANFMLEILMEGHKPVVTELQEFEHCDKSLIKAFFGDKIQSNKIWLQGKSYKIFHSDQTSQVRSVSLKL